MPDKPPTPAQRRLLTAIRMEGVERRCYKARVPGGVDLTWHWVGCRTEQRFQWRTITACETRGWVKVIRGEMKPGAPEGMSGLQIAMGNWRLPDRLEIVPQGQG